MKSIESSDFNYQFQGKEIYDVTIGLLWRQGECEIDLPQTAISHCRTLPHTACYGRIIESIMSIPHGLTHAGLFFSHNFSKNMKLIQNSINFQSEEIYDITVESSLWCQGEFKIDLSHINTAVSHCRTLSHTVSYKRRGFCFSLQSH